MIIVLCGLDGAGKSAQMSILHDWLRQMSQDVMILDKWDIMNRLRHPECRFVSPPLKDLKVCISEMEGIGRAMFLFWSIALTSRESLTNPERIYLLDGYWMKHAATEMVYGCDPEWIEATTRTFPKPDICFLLDIDPEIALKRKPELTPYECGRNPLRDPNDFLRHQMLVRPILQKWCDENDWHRIDASQSISDVSEAIKGRLTQCLSLGGL